MKMHLLNTSIFLLILTVSQAADGAKPNIVYILADDMAYADAIHTGGTICMAERKSMLSSSN